MKIIYFGNFDQYFKTEMYITYALRSLGHEVVCLSGKSIKSDSRFVSSLIKLDADFILFGKTKNPLAGKLIESLRGIVKTVCWQHDLYAIPPRPNFPPEFSCDIVFSTDGGKEQRLKDAGVNHHILRQGIHQPDTLEPLEPVTQFEIPILFIGHPGIEFQRDRGVMIKSLRKQWGDKFRTINNSRGLDLVKLLRNSGVVVGDSYSSPNYWSNRIYEVLGRGGFLLHPKTIGLEEEFKDGEHYVSFERGNFNQLNGLIETYLKDHSERERIRKQGFSYVRENFTYTHRCESLIQTVQKAL